MFAKKVSVFELLDKLSSVEWLVLMNPKRYLHSHIMNTFQPLCT